MASCGSMTTEAATIHWGTRQDRFGLTLPEESASLAKAIFGPWRRGSGPVRQHWFLQTIERRWQAYSDDGASFEPRDSCDEALTLVEYAAVQHLSERSPDRLTFHAALLGRRGRGLLIHGPPLAGKTTLACALWRRGWDLYCDDMTCVDAASCFAWAAPRRVSVRPESAALIGEDLCAALDSSNARGETSKSRLYHPPCHTGSVERRGSVRLAAVVFLGRTGVELGSAEPRAMHEAEALMSLLPAANLTRRWRTDRVMRLLRPLAEEAPAMDLGRGPLEAMSTAVEAWFDRAVAA
jgi:hypothetical protein